MWNKTNIEGKEYILKISNENYRFSIMLSDFIQIWCEQVQEEEIIERCKEENPMFEADDETFMKHVMSLVKCENSDIIRNISQSEGMLLLKLQTILEGIKFKFSCRLQKRTPEFYYENITRPLLTVVQELQIREDTLCLLLAKKDIEINEYKMNGAQITRKSVETQKFNRSIFKEEGLESLKKFNEDPTFNPCDVFTSCTVDLYRERAVVSNNIDEEKGEITSAWMRSDSVLNKKKRSPSKKKIRAEENSKTEPEQEEEEEVEVKIKKRKPAFKGLKL